MFSPRRIAPIPSSLRNEKTRGRGLRVRNDSFESKRDADEERPTRSTDWMSVVSRRSRAEGPPALISSSSSSRISMLPVRLLVTLLVLGSVAAAAAHNSLSVSQPKRSENSADWCKGPIDGDCNPYNCGGGCESKYIRFYDPAYRVDRTIKSCFCQQERLCSILGMHAFSGCKSYASLSSIAQKFARYWSMDSRDRKNRNSNSARYRYSDKSRHIQLLNGNSRFCCRATVQKRLALQLKSSSFSFNCLIVSLLVSVFYFLIY